MKKDILFICLTLIIFAGCNKEKPQPPKPINHIISEDGDIYTFSGIRIHEEDRYNGQMTTSNDTLRNKKIIFKKNGEVDFSLGICFLPYYSGSDSVTFRKDSTGIYQPLYTNRSGDGGALLRIVGDSLFYDLAYDVGCPDNGYYEQFHFAGKINR